MAKRANAKTTEVNSSHAAYISHPKETAKDRRSCHLRIAKVVEGTNLRWDAMISTNGKTLLKSDMSVFV
jgi:hypothetical protein